MFWFSTIRDLKNRLSDLEIKTKRREIKEACAEGRHEWEMKDISYNKPYVRCIHCYKAPAEITNGK